MNTQVTNVSIDGSRQLLVENAAISRDRIAGIIVQTFMIYLVSRDLLVPGLILSHFVPLTNAVQVRSSIAMMIAWIAIRGRGLAANFSGFGPWGWIVLGPYALVLVIEGILAVVGDESTTTSGAPRAIVIMLVNASIIVFGVGMAYLFGARALKPQAVLRFLLQPYCYFAIFIAATGLASWLLVVLGVVKIEDWLLVGLIKKWDAFSVSGSFYSMPYYLGLLAHESRGSFLGLLFPRATGLFQVPSSAAFFVTPALFLVPLVIDPRSHKWTLRVIYVLLLGFLFAVQSATNFIVLGAIGALFLGKLIMTGRVRGRLVASFTFLIVATGLWASASGGTLGLKWSIRGEDYVQTVLHTVDRGSFLGPGYLNPLDVPVGILSTATIFAHVGLVALLGLAMMLWKSPHWYVGGALAYVALHSVKKLGHHLTMGFYIYMLIVCALALAVYWNESRSSRRPAGFQRPPGPFKASRS